MNAVRKRKISILLATILVATLVTGLVLYALRQNINLFYTPSQINHGEAPFNRMLRLGGMVVKGSIAQDKNKVHITFKVTDYKHTISVEYAGILPTLFREGQGVVALGKLIDENHFQASEVLAKHDANYMPQELKALKSLS